MFSGIVRRPRVSYLVLTPNMKGFERALEADAMEVAVFGAASEVFSQKNIKCSIMESVERFRPIIVSAQKKGIHVRGYIPCVLSCPYQGVVPVVDVLKLALQMYEMGCYEISLGDTISIGTPLQAKKMVGSVAKRVPVSKLALRFQDTRGQALQTSMYVLNFVCLLLIHLSLVWEFAHMHMIQAVM